MGATGCADGEGTTVSSIPIVDLAGRRTTIADEVSGRATLVSLWAVWCQPCKKELPVLDDIASEHPDLAVIALNIGDDPDAVRRFVDDLSVNSSVMIDRDGDVLSALDAPTVPVTVILDGDGDIVWKHIGAVDADTVRSAVNDAT
ncbi:MAG: cytochrome c biosis protein [Actinomycetota bacterium]|jgi:thiol-disulfide isomerase/thioredoxin